MSFSGFLSYLYSKWVSLWDFLANWYDSIRGLAYNWGIYLSNVLTLARQYADNLGDTLRNWVTLSFRAVSDAINSISSLIESYDILGWRKFILGVLDALRQWVRGLISDAKITVQGWIEQSIATIKSWVTPLVDEVKRQIAPYVQLWKWLLEIWGWLKSLFHLFTSDFISRLITVVSELFSFLVMFSNDPLGFIFGIIRDDLLPLILWLVAMGLAYDDTDLGNYGDYHGDAYEAGSGSIAVTGDGSKLPARPLGNIWVSGYRFNPHHHGVDLGLAKGQPVYASHSGKVTVAGWSTVGYGNNVVISGNPWWSRYAHLESYAVRVGDNVDAGQMIGRGDSTGHSTGNHLHFEVKYKGRFVDPLTVIPPG